MAPPIVRHGRKTSGTGISRSSYQRLAEWTEAGRKLDYNAVAWEDEIIIVPWTLYSYYGDKKVLEDNYEKMAILIEKRLKQLVRGLYVGEDVPFVGDHCNIETVPKTITVSIPFVRSI